MPRKPRIKFVGPTRPKKLPTTSATKAKIPLNKYQIKTTGVTKSQAANIQYRPISKKLKLGDLGYNQQRQLKAKASIEKQGFKLDTKTGEILDPKKLRPPVLRTATPVGELTIPIKRTDKNYRVKTKLEPIAKIKPKVFKTKILPKSLSAGTPNKYGRIEKSNLPGTKKVVGDPKIGRQIEGTKQTITNLKAQKGELKSIQKNIKEFSPKKAANPKLIESYKKSYKTIDKKISHAKMNPRFASKKDKGSWQRITKGQLKKYFPEKFVKFAVKRVASKALGPAGIISDIAESARLTKSIGGHLKRIFVGPKKPNWKSPKVGKSLERHNLPVKDKGSKTARVYEPQRPFPKEKSFYKEGSIRRKDEFLRNTSKKKPITSTNIAEKVKTFKLKPTPLKRVNNPMVSTPLGKDGITRYTKNRMTRK